MQTAIQTERTAQSWYPGSRPKLQAINEDRPFAAEVEPVLQPEGPAGSRTTAGLAEGLSTFKGGSVDAAISFLKFLAKPENYAQVMLIEPVHNIPSAPGFVETDIYQNGTGELPGISGLDDAWSQDQIDRAFDASSDFIAPLNETSPPNPYAGVIVGNNIPTNASFKVTIEGKDPSTAVDEIAQEVANILEEAKS
jgi:ABC-type glycerol-3-phosphate transport system substrate-binding protein